MRPWLAAHRRTAVCLFDFHRPNPPKSAAACSRAHRSHPARARWRLPAVLLEIGGNLGDFDRADVQAHGLEEWATEPTRLGFTGLGVLPQLIARLRRMVGIDLDDALEEIVLLCVVQTRNCAMMAVSTSGGSPVPIASAIRLNTRLRRADFVPACQVASDVWNCGAWSTRHWASCAIVNGLWITASMPASRHSSAAAPIDCAVKATMGIRLWFSAFSACRMIRAAVKPSICGMLPSMRMMSCAAV